MLYTILKKQLLWIPLIFKSPLQLSRFINGQKCEGISTKGNSSREKKEKPDPFEKKHRVKNQANTIQALESFKLKAIEHLEIAIRNDQEHIPSILTLCEIYREIGEYKKSQTLLNQALTCCKENCELHYQQSKLYHQLNDFENALTSIDYAIDLKPEEAKLYEFALQNSGR